jgi:dGTPase
MRTSGGFEGNDHTLRLLTRLEKYKQQGWGINPTRRLILAVLK